MATDKLREIIERAIPLDPNCEVNRSEQNKRRARLRIDIEELMRPVVFDPRDKLPIDYPFLETK